MGVITFCNRRVSTYENSQSGLRLACRDNWEALSRVTAVRIKILRTEESTIPCMRNLRIFGLSSGDKKFASLELELVKKSRWSLQDNRSNFNFFGGDSKLISEEKHSVNPIEGKIIKEIDQEPPPEFLDSITHCLMVLPMTLPSGHHVDRSTLEKCQDSFAAWGGQPRDPFTGKLFSQKVKPVFNADLKSRIDAFLLKTESKEFNSVGRTLGTAQKIKEFLNSKGMKRN